MVLPDSQYPFNYKVSENILYINFKSEKARDFDYIFVIDGNKLSLSGGEGTDSVTYILTRLDQ